ncbi:MAG: tetratricopeptide repeat protein [Candidatus Cloacimonadota bacterium]|nr:tetratricopeptide repeat protein [Candidatus Cloacimonadota bacterium]
MNKQIDSQTKIISILISLIFLLLFVIIFLGETGISDIVKQIEVGRRAEASTSFEYGLEYLKQDKFSGAIYHLTKAVKLDPKFSQAYTNLAIAYAKSGKNDKAILILQKALKNNPKEKYLVYHNLAQVYKTLDNEKAEVYYLKAIDDHPQPIDVYFDFGQFLWNQHKREEAVEFFLKGVQLYTLEKFYIAGVKRGIAMFKDHTRVYMKLSDIDLESISSEDVKEFDNIVFDNYYKLNNPKVAKIMDQIGYFYYQTFEFTKATEYFEKSIEMWKSKKNRAYINLKKLKNRKIKTQLLSK